MAIPRAKIGFKYSDIFKFIFGLFLPDFGGEGIISAIHVADFVNIIYCAGFKPVVVDINAETYCIDYDDLEKKINHNTVLLFITHLSGLVTDMGKIMEISRNRAIPFVEDC